jgi:peptide deformylase
VSVPRLPQVSETADPVASEPDETEPRTDAEPEAEAPLDPEVAARRAAALAHVRKFGDPVLRTRARAVDRIDDALRAEIARMGELMDGALGIGLAATQVGVLHRVLVYRVGSDAPLVGLVNPEVEWRGDELENAEEGCLDEHGERITVEAAGLEARVLQHEIDHLDGVLILDRTSREQRKEAVRALREAMADPI